MSLREVLESAADDAGLPGSAAASADGSITWSFEGRPFASLDAAGRIASFRLDPVLAAAAQRTPDAAASSHGPEWVEFAPLDLDGHAEDRAVAWFVAAARRARG
jgi:hypothetical protein